MAAIERAEGNDEGRAREWTARAVNAAPDPAWTADGYVSDHWLPASPITGRIDAFEWRVPLTGTLSAEVIEPAIEPSATVASGTTISAEGAVPAPDKGAPPGAREPAQIKAEARPEPRQPETGLGDGKPAPVIPLVHAPDDPGPEGVDESEPASAPSDGNWRILG